ncbi:hypothetical protein F4818DRAFT_435737 [Hypoxylon cercidicola]|nr:hypothetical protein F4818DRAFT_435737 [Hypoxylon cercidicola]
MEAPQPTNVEAPQPAAVEAPQLTTSESRFAATLFKYLPKDLELNWEAFAKDMKFKGAGVARVRFHQIRRRLVADPSTGTSGGSGGSGGLGGSPKRSKVTKATKHPAKAKRLSKSFGKSPALGGDDEDDKAGNAKGLQAVKKFVDQDEDKGGFKAE